MNITEPGQWPAGIDVTVNVNFEVRPFISVTSVTSVASSVDSSSNDIIVGSVKDAQEAYEYQLKGYQTNYYLKFLTSNC